MIKLHQLVTGDATDKLILADFWDDMGNDGEIFRCQARNQMSSGQIFWIGQSYTVPTQDLIALDSGDSFLLGLTKTGRLFEYKSQVSAMLAMPLISAISSGGYHSLALTVDGSVVAWGDNDFDRCNVPEGLTDVIAVAAGDFHSLALKKDGTVVAWGDTDFNKCLTDNLKDIIAISAGMEHSLALTRDCKVIAWGKLAEGQCDVPEDLPDIIAVSAGDYHSLALTVDGKIIAWGDNYYHQTEVPELPKIVAISAGDYQSMALAIDGKVFSWGRDCLDCSQITDAIAINAGITSCFALIKNRQA